MGICAFCANCCLVLVALFAVLIGYLLSFEHPVGPIFSTMHTLEGLGRPKTEPVPNDFAIVQRPKGERFLTLPSGSKMPANGIGMCCRHTAYHQDSVRRTVLWYLLQGGRHIDTAAVYMNHVAVGQGIRDAMARGVPRSEIFVTSKVWPDSFGYNSTAAKVPRMLEELGLEYIDLVLLHAPRNIHPRLLWNKKFGGQDEFTNYDCRNHQTCRAESWRALSGLRGKGLIKDVGVSNFNIVQMKELQALDLAPIAANQLQYHPWAPEFQKEIVAYCHQHAIVVTAYFSLGGLMGKDKALKIEVLNHIAKAHSKTPGQVLLRWAIENNVSVIPGTGNPKHMRENLDIYSFSLSREDMARIEALSSDPIAHNFMFFEL